MKRQTILRSLFCLLVMAVAFVARAEEQGDYCVKYGADVKVEHSTHYPIMVGVSNVRGEEQKLEGIASAPKCAAYFDKTETVFEVKSGETITPLITINGSWMHGYVFVDWNNNKEFEVNLTGEGPYIKGEGNELVCWSLYSRNGDGNSGWNSAGLAVSGDVLAPGSFRVPEGLAVGSTYRMRFAVMWNCIDPTGNYAKFLIDGGSIIDVTLRISGIASEEDKMAYPINDYAEPRVGTTPDAAAWNALDDGLIATWGSRDIHYKLHEVPSHELQTEATLRAWKGERANIQAVLYSKTDQDTLSVRMTEWKKGGVATGIEDAGDARFVNYVITDDFTSCGNHPMSLDTWLVADVIDQDKPHAVPAMETRPVWCTIEVPRNVEAGEYTTALEVVDEAGKVVKSLALTIVVDSHSLPTVAEQKFHLDFWQQPYAVSRYYGVDRWSDEHFEALRPYLQALGRAGQRVVSAILFYEPWGEQTHDLFDPMVQTTKKSDGTWAYDYTIFDKYVELCAECGIDKFINCFSMVPWDMSFRYWDEASGSYQAVQTNTATEEYRELWTSFLTAFKAHLIEKEWFEKTNIALDERQEADMLNAYAIANNLGFNMALAGNYHGSLNDKFRDLCAQLGQEHQFTAATIAERRAKGWVTTYYTSCANAEPNIYTNSYPAEAAYLPIYAAKMNLDGYLHWAWMNWDEHPLTDSRFRKFGSGDTYCYYPGNRSSIRFERLIEGIHQYEKIQILREEYKDNLDMLYKLNTLLNRFNSATMAGTACAALVNDLEAFLNGEEVEVPPTIATGYYHMMSKATARKEHLYNDAAHTGNGNRLTLQSDAMVNTNNGIWKITSLGGGKVAIKNGDGNPIVAGGTYASLMGSYSQLTIASTLEDGGTTYYYFDAALNCSNNNSSYMVGGTEHLTTWAGGPATADDNLWRFEPVSVEGKTIYEVVVDHADGYVIYNNGTTTQKAFNGGFFIVDGTITEAQLSAAMLSNELRDGATITIEGTTITLSGVKPLIVKQDLYNTSKGDGVIPPYRIPGITTANNGRLITAAARLVCGTDPGFGEVDVVCRISDNNGDTWSNMILVADGTGEESAERNIFETAFGDPAIVADRTSNEVLIIAVAGCTQYGNSRTTRENPNMIATIHSTDNGETWGTPVDVTEPIYSLFDSGNPMQAAFVGGGKVFQSRIVKKDKYYRLYAAMCARPNGNRVIYSDDFGRTWHALGGASALPAPGGDEPKCEELPDGRVILSSRVGGGRIYNIYTYTNTLTAEGSWGSDVKCTFEGSGKTPGGNSTNGEILIVPVQRNSDQKEMYLALQSLPTGSGRSNVGIFYKELTDVTDINSVANFSTDWNGFYEVTTKASAYSSMDLQADNRIGFIYEETLTGWGKRDNPVSTCFPNGEGTHNFDGFDNIYVAYPLEYITGGAYSIKRNVDRRAYLRDYFTALTADASDEVKAAMATALNGLSPEPTTQQIDNLYTLMAVAEEGNDTWYYIAFTEGRSGSFVASGNKGYMVDNLTFTATQAKSDNQLWKKVPVGDGTYHIVSKTGKYLVPASSITSSTTAPDKVWTIEASATEGYDVIYNPDVPCQVHALKGGSMTNWGFNSLGDGAARKNDAGCNFVFIEAAKLSDITFFDAEAGKVGYYTDEVIATYKETAAAAMTAAQVAAAKEVVFASTERNMPVSGKAYTFKNVHKDGTTMRWYKYDGTKIDLTANEAEATPFVCRLLDNGKYVFVCNEGKYMTWRGGDSGNTGVRDTYDATADAYTDVTISKMTTGNNINGDLSDTRYVSLWGRRNANSEGCVVVAKSGPSFSAAGEKYTVEDRHQKVPFYNDNHSSAFIMEEAPYANTPKLKGVGEGELLSEDLHNTYMATFSAPFPTVVPEGVTAYYAATKEGKYVDLNTITEDAIPANTGVILVSENNGNAVMLPAAGETEANAAGNLMGHSAGADKNMNGISNAYLLTNGSQGVGFYLCSGGTLAANKSYLNLEGGQQAVCIRLAGTTDIESSEIRNEKSEMIYDLAGRRVQQMGKGIYIVNNKKVIR